MQSLPYRLGLSQPFQTFPIAESDPSTRTITALNQFLSPLLHLPPQIRYKILAFALGGHHIRVYSFNGRVSARVCPECYFGLPYAMTLGPAVPVRVLLALGSVSRQIYFEAKGFVLAQNQFIGCPVPLTTLFKRKTLYHAIQVKRVTVNVLTPFRTLEDGKTVAGLSEEVLEVLKILCGMRNLQRVSVDWDGKHDNHGEAHDYFKARVMEIFAGSGRKDVQVRVPVLGMKR